MNIVVADDHALVRKGLIEFLKSGEPDWRFQEAGGFDEVRDRLTGGGIDLIIVDLNMPGMHGANSLRELRTVAPGTRMIVLTGQDDRNTILDCLSAGVHGYLPKSGDTAQILDALRVVVGGGVYVPPILSQIPREPEAVAAPVPEPQAPAAAAPTGQETLRLSGRQQQVLNLLAEGRSTKDIARILDLGIGTVKVHLAAIYRTLGARNRMEAIVKAGVVSRSGH